MMMLAIVEANALRMGCLQSSEQHQRQQEVSIKYARAPRKPNKIYNCDDGSIFMRPGRPDLENLDTLLGDGKYVATASVAC